MKLTETSESSHRWTDDAESVPESLSKKGSAREEEDDVFVSTVASYVKKGTRGHKRPSTRSPKPPRLDREAQMVVGVAQATDLAFSLTEFVGHADSRRSVGLQRAWWTETRIAAASRFGYHGTSHTSVLARPET